ncbi:MAG: mannose-1-phosphate guanylyltransferase/mannose-6-phosphate isomerase [Desulfovibrio sp.]|nr:mannose-1-phosphate guanylyltransferase/mannose-6-phosphate isomerase [Desulfovibrio sp.]
MTKRRTVLEKIYPLILSGGSGTRLWPLSRGFYPKQFMDLGGDTLFSRTVARALALPDCAPPIAICNEGHRFLAATAMQEQGLLTESGGASILLEPAGRNTAPAIALGTLCASLEREDPLILVLSSDHVIEPVEAFADAVRLAARGAEAGKIAVFGVKPGRPETGFGYIRAGREIYPGLFEVEKFVEKPDEEGARAMLADGNCLWNSGMFMFKASVFWEELESHAPKVFEICRSVWGGRVMDLDFIRFPEAEFAACPGISMDYAVMEHTKKACVARLDAAWSDMGSWESFYESGTRDAAGNVLRGDIVQVDAKNSYVHAEHRLVAVLGIDGIDVVETSDAVLVMPRGRSQDVRLVLEELRKRGRSEADNHLRVFRPWGSFENLVAGERFQVKLIMVKPGGILSKQMHHHRSEHWILVRGTAKVTLAGETRIVREDESVYIPLGAVHRVENPGRIPLELIEIQTGSYLGEDDIVRFDDVYGRDFLKAPE